MTEHTIRITSVNGKSTPWCPCGWKGKTTRRGEAGRSAAEHVESFKEESK